MAAKKMTTPLGVKIQVITQPFTKLTPSQLKRAMSKLKAMKKRGEVAHVEIAVDEVDGLFNGKIEYIVIN